MSDSGIEAANTVRLAVVGPLAPVEQTRAEIEELRAALDRFNLCFNCGIVSPEHAWTYWRHGEPEDSEPDELIPAESGWTDPIARCPACGWEHVDDDSNPGIIDGTWAECWKEREGARTDWAEQWHAVALERIVEQTRDLIVERLKDDAYREQNMQARAHLGAISNHIASLPREELTP